MKKITLLFVSMIICLTACGKDKNEAAEENEDWKRAYVEVVKIWNNDHESDDSIGYELAYIDDDNIPELVLFCDDEAWYALDMYTCIDNKAVHMQTDQENEGSEYLSPGCQGKGEAYLEKEGIYLQSSGMMGSVATTGYRMQGDKFYEIFKYSYADASWDESKENPYSYHLEYIDKGGKEVIIDREITEEDEYYEVEAVPEAKDLEKEFDISFDSKRGFGSEHMSYLEMMDCLGFPVEAD